MTVPTATDLVNVAVDSGVALVRLNRPDRLNAWTMPMEEQYFDLLEQLDNDAAVRVVLLTGAGRGFCPGLDAAVLAELSTRDNAAQQRTRPPTYALQLRKPLVVAINGACAGMGLLQALVGDVRFAADDAKIAASFTRRGLPAEMGMPWLMARQIGQSRATDLLLSGRTIRGSEAARIGLVSSAVPVAELLPTALAYAQDLAENCAPLALSIVKGQLAAEWSRSMAESAAAAAELMTRPDIRSDLGEGVASFTSRRAPDFAPLPPRRTTQLVGG